MEQARLARLAQLIKGFALSHRLNSTDVASGLVLLAAALAIAAGVDREGFTKGAGDAYDEAVKRAAGGLPRIFGPDGRALS